MASIDLETCWCLGKAIRRVLEFAESWSNCPAADILERAQEHIARTSKENDLKDWMICPVLDDCPICRKEEENK